MAVVVGAAVVTTTAVGEGGVVGGDRRSSVGSSPVRWLLRIMPLLIRTLRPMHRHRSMGRGGGVTPRNLITPTHKLAPAGSEPFSHSETETETRVRSHPTSACRWLWARHSFRWALDPHCVQIIVSSLRQLLGRRSAHCSPSPG